jgi:hypothetical protein
MITQSTAKPSSNQRTPAQFKPFQQFNRCAQFKPKVKRSNRSSASLPSVTTKALFDFQELMTRSIKGNCLAEYAIQIYMDGSAKGKRITSRVIRPGDPVPDPQFWDDATPEDRINAVWELTLLCLTWQPNQGREPRLQRSISRIQRPAS